MTFSGVLLLGGFVLFAALMVMRLLPALLALPLMAAWIAWVAGLPFLTWANEVLLGGAMRLYGTYIGIFGSEAALYFYFPGIAIAAITAITYIIRHVPLGSGGEGSLLEDTIEYGTVGGELPGLFAYYGEKQLDLCGLATREQVLDLMKMETEFLPEDEKIIVLAVK